MLKHPIKQAKQKRHKVVVVFSPVVLLTVPLNLTHAASAACDMCRSVWQLSMEGSLMLFASGFKLFERPTPWTFPGHPGTSPRHAHWAAGATFEDKAARLGRKNLGLAGARTLPWTHARSWCRAWAMFTCRRKNRSEPLKRSLEVVRNHHCGYTPVFDGLLATVGIQGLKTMVSLGCKGGTPCLASARMPLASVLSLTGWRRFKLKLLEIGAMLSLQAAAAVLKV